MATRELDRGLLSTYLNDHLAGATGVLELARRAAGQNGDSEYGRALERMAGEIAEDRDALLRAMRLLGARRDPLKPLVAWLAEKAGRLKPNGRLVSYSPLSRLEEVEMIALGVSGKLSLWRTLRGLAAAEPVLSGLGLDDLIARAERQREELDGLRASAAERAFHLG